MLKDLSKVRESWKIHGPKMLFDQHEEEVTPDVVDLADMVNGHLLLSTSIQHHNNHQHYPYLHHKFGILINTKVAEFYLGPGGSQNYDFEHIQVCGSHQKSCC